MCIIGFVVAAILLFFIFFRRRESYSDEKLSTALSNTKLSKTDQETFLKAISAIEPGNLGPLENVYPIYNNLSEEEKGIVGPLTEQAIKAKVNENSGPITTPMRSKMVMPITKQASGMPTQGKQVALASVMPMNQEASGMKPLPRKPAQPESGYKPYMCKDGPDGLVCKVKK